MRCGGRVSESRQVLALRKEVLVARSALLRLKAASELAALRECLTLPRAALSIAASRPARSAVLGLVLWAAGRGKIARAVRIAAGVIALAKLAATLTRTTASRAPNSKTEG